MSRSCCNLVRRGGTLAGWVVPASVLALMPKCPACVAGYVAVATGLGVSVSVAAYLRSSAIVLCVLTLLYFTARGIRRISGERS